jgi:peptidyl-prolyl cis-trans isomerase SurA
MVKLNLLRRGICIAALCLGAMPGVKAEQLVDGIAAVVNEEIITFTDVKKLIGSQIRTLYHRYAPNDPALQKELDQLQKAALDELVEQRLIIQQFHTKGGKIPENYIEEDIVRIIEEQYGRDRSVFIKTLEAHGSNLEAYKEQVRDRIIVQYMRNSEIGNEIFISPYKIEKYYKEHLDDFKDGEKVKLRMIYVKNQNESEVESNRNLAKELLLKVATTGDFSQTASNYSEGAEKNKGGDMGFVDKDVLREELREVAFNLKPGQLSPVIETKDGFYILRVDEKKPAKTSTLLEARDLIERILVQEEKERLSKRWLQTLKRSAYIRMH